MKSRAQLENQLKRTQEWIRSFENSAERFKDQIAITQVLLDAHESQLESLRMEEETLKRELGLDNEPGV